jgi:hypothetical protein
MTAESTPMSSESTMNRNQPPSERAEHPQTTVLLRGEAVNSPEVKTSAPKEATVVVRGETADSQSKDSHSKDQTSQSKDKGNDRDKDNTAPLLNEANVKMRERLPVLDDDADVGVQRNHVVTRDGKPDLAFAGTLLASAAPTSAPKGEWNEYRIYETTAGKHVFSKTGRNVNAEHDDTHEAEVFDPAPTSMPSKLLKSARDLTHSRQANWTDAAADFFGYDPLAKELYKKLGGQFEEHIS